MIGFGYMYKDCRLLLAQGCKGGAVCEEGCRRAVAGACRCSSAGGAAASNMEGVVAPAPAPAPAPEGCSCSAGRGGG
jgi:hypothetical protein